MPRKTPKKAKIQFCYITSCISWFSAMLNCLSNFSLKLVTDNRTIFLVVLNMMQLALIKSIFQLLSLTTVGKVRCKLHPPVARRYWLPGEHRKSYWQKKCLTVKESLEDAFLQKASTLKSSFSLRRIICFWGWCKCGVLSLLLKL